MPRAATKCTLDWTRSPVKMASAAAALCLLATLPSAESSARGTIQADRAEQALDVLLVTFWSDDLHYLQRCAPNSTDLDASGGSCSALDQPYAFLSISLIFAHVSPIDSRCPSNSSRIFLTFLSHLSCSVPHFLFVDVPSTAVIVKGREARCQACDDV